MAVWGAWGVVWALSSGSIGSKTTQSVEMPELGFVRSIGHLSDIGTESGFTGREIECE